MQLAERTGVEQPPAVAESLGIKQFKDGTPTEPLLRGGSFTLGVNEVSPLAMAAAYATFAAHGQYCPPQGRRSRCWTPRASRSSSPRRTAARPSSRRSPTP